MFPRSYFPESWFPPSYWPKGGSATARTGGFKGVGGRRHVVDFSFVEHHRSVLDGFAKRQVEALANRVLANRINHQAELVYQYKQSVETAMYSVLLSEI